MRTDKKRLPSNIRIVVMALLFVAVFIVYTARLMNMQLINAGEWVKDLNPDNSSTATVTAARGEILDRYGRPLAVNREGYNLILDGAYLPAKEINSTLLALTALLKTTGEAWRDELPLASAAPYGFAEADDADKVRTASLKRRLKLNTYATAENCFDAMVSRYKLTNYTKDTQRALMGIRYTMETEDYSVATRYVFAEDISLDTTLKIKENPDALTGVDVDVVPIREYAAPDIAPHILGTVGPMYAKDWAKNKEEYLKKGYRLSDVIGKSGMELAAEDYLRGTDGKKAITQDATGKVTSVKVLQEPVAGSTVILTIDSRLQKIAQDSLANMISTMKRNNPADAANIKGGGAAVVMQVNTGEILAAATYPSYNMNDYKKNAELLNKDTAQPLFNRAFRGGYPSGSAFKPATALAGLQTGAITATSTVRCTGIYNYYPDTPFKCFGRTAHGTNTVVGALSKSCNIFFFETARRVGIANLNQYCRLFGLGVPTGVEVEEYTGILAGPEYRAAQKKIWNPGDTLQAAIGQSDNSLTPLQLAVYTTTIANSGTRYAAHLTKEVRSYGLDKLVYAYEPKVLNTTGIAKAYYDVVKQGMLSVTEDGTASGVFSHYPIKVGGKTGTAQNPTPYDHSVFIAFAPYGNPEIAVAIVLEQALKGAKASAIARSIFDGYFFPALETYTPQPANELLR